MIRSSLWRWVGLRDHDYDSWRSFFELDDALLYHPPMHRWPVLKLLLG